MTVYYAVIADVIASRELSTARRGKLQESLRKALPALNARWQEYLAARLAITMGDELQCLLSSSSAIWPVVHGIRGLFDNVDWLVACGRGPLSTPLEPGLTAPELDGPCFHAARGALARAKKERMIMAFEGFADRRLDGAAGYYAALYWGWTRRQRQVANLWRGAPFVPEIAAAERAGEVHPSALSHLRRRMAWPLVESGDKMFRSILEAS
jgi:hypothetical protein